MPYAKALLPSLIIGYLIPTVLLYIPHDTVFTTQALVAFWQPTPIFVNILLLAFSEFFSIGYKDPKPSVEGTTDDVKYLQRVYLASFVVGAVSHWFTIAACLGFVSSDPNLSFFHAIWPNLDLMMGNRPPTGLYEGLHYIFQMDYWFIFGSSLIWAYLTILDTNRVARAYVAPIKALAVMSLNTVIFGPAATVAAIWYSRETTLAGLQKSETKKRN